MKLYRISGLGADKSVFQHLTLECNLIPVDWIMPKTKENIENYSKRLAQQINTNEQFGIIGVSFGGLIAVELSKLLNPALTILISSAETKEELRSLYRLIGKLGIIKLIPSQLFDPPRILANWLFGAKDKKLLKQILDNTDLKFSKWAVNELLSWKSTERLENRILKISGASDKLMPPVKNKGTRIIDEGEHFMIVDRANEVSDLINKELKF